MAIKEVSLMLAKRLRPVEYPTSDGKPMAETDWHRELMTELINTLQARYANRPDVYVSGNLLMFYEKGNRRKHRSPDVLVTFGIPKRLRPNYLVWEEGKAPDIVFEITSSSTRYEDKGPKRVLYASLGVREYVMFDPFGDYLKSRLQVRRLEGDSYVPVVGAPLQSQVLGLEFRIDGWRLRLVDPATGEVLKTPGELVEDAKQQADEAKQQADEAKQQADEAKQQADEAKQQADEARRQVQQARSEAVTAAAHTATMEAEIERLKRRLGDV